MRRQRHHGNDTEPQHGQKRDQEFGAVRKLKHDNLARTQTVTMEVRGKSLRLRANLAERQAAITLCEGYAIRCCLGQVSKILRN